MVYDNDYDHFNFDEKVIFIVNGRGFERIYKIIKTNNISDNKRQQTTTVDNKRLFNGFVLTGVASLRHKSYKKLQDMTDKKPFDKEHGAKISFSELVKLIDQKCDYKFAIIDYEVDDELKLMAKNAGINLDGYKHVIELVELHIPKKGMAKKVTIECPCQWRIIFSYHSLSSLGILL